MTELWPYRPRYDLLLENLEWFTEPIVSKVSEQRLALRSAPRQYLTYSSIMKEDRFARASQIMKANAIAEVYLPVWHEQQVLSGIVSSAATTLDVDTTVGDFRGAGSLVVIWSNDQVYSVREIDSMTDSTITLTDSVGTQMYFPVICPVRKAIPSRGFNIRRDTVYSEVDMKWLVRDNIDLADSWVTDYPQYQTKDVITETTLLIFNIAENLTRAAEYIDNGFGVVEPQPIKDYIDFGQMMGFSEARPGNLWRRRKWLHSLRGRQKTFWLPSQNHDLLLQSTVSGASALFPVKSIGALDRYIGKKVMILLKNGNRYFRSITNAGNIADIDTLTLSSTLGVAVAPSDISLFCFISLVRSDADNIQISHGMIDSLINFPVMEVPS